jgi:Holliday junction resolvase RusA-like endonuclease
MYIDPKAAAYKDEVIVTVRQSGQRVPDGDLEMWIWLFAPDRRRRDASNHVKLIEDAVFAALGEDDSRVVGSHVWLAAELSKDPHVWVKVDVTSQHVIRGRVVQA